jgi:hypothetical protein
MDLHTMARSIGTWGLGVGVVVLGAAAESVAQSDWTLHQVTALPPSGSWQLLAPTVSGNGSLVACISDVDLGGQNPDGGFEAFLVDVRTGGVTALTDGDGDNISGLPPVIDDSGATVAFALNTVASPNLALYLWRGGVGLTKLADHVYPIDMSGDGRWIAVHTSANPTGGNPDGNLEVMLYDVQSDAFTQVTDTVGAVYQSHAVAVDDTGTRVLLRSNADLGGLNPGGLYALFLWQAGQPSPFSVVLDAANAGVDYVSASDDLGRVAAVGPLDLTGGNPDGSWEVFLGDLSGPTFTQLTDTTGSTWDKSTAMNGRGDRVLIHTHVDLTGSNPDGSSELFLWEASAPGLRQITAFADQTATVYWTFAVDGGGGRVVFRGLGDLVPGGDPDGSGEYYVLVEGEVFYDGFETGDAGAWEVSP